MANANLRNAKKEQNGEFYTQLGDIEKELCHYKKHFEGKTVFCNCDDPYESNFFYYFATRFNDLKLKKLICTCYDGSPVAYTQMSFFEDGEKSVERKNRHAYKVVITEVKDLNGDGTANIYDIDLLLRHNGVVEQLKGNGDFRSEECIELLKEADIVVTNPPFALFREFLSQLIEYKKKFLIIGNKTLISYHDIFPYLKNGLMWVGYRNINSDMWFIVPDDNNYEKIVDGKRLKHISSVWLTNLDIARRHEPFPFSKKKYNENDYPNYFNYDAINVNNVDDIPNNYYGEMGVPITFFGSHNPDEFEIIGLGISNSGLEIGVRPYLPEHKEYRKNVQHKGAVNGDLYMIDKDGHPLVPFARILIRRKK